METRLYPLALIVMVIIGSISGIFATIPVQGSAESVTSAPPDPATDVIGWEDGFWHNESITVDQSDGLNQSEMDIWVARSMARVEQLRKREFIQDVPVEVISRQEYKNRTSGRSASEDFVEWNNQVWEALFIVGEDRNVQNVLQSTTSSAVVGFYSPRDNEIKIITENPDEPTIDNATLIHELVHALQDQHEDLTSRKFVADTQDGTLAIDGLIEGEANYIEQLYSMRCGGQWSCVRSPSSGGGGGTAGIHWGIYVTLFFPYSDGPVYVHNLIQQGGWEAVNEAYSDPPESSEQIIHVTKEKPEPIHFTDTSNQAWSLYPQQGVSGSDTVGEASIFAMFWYQSRNYGANILDWRQIAQVSGKFDVLDYSTPAATGWANDRVFPYYKQTQSGEKYGYVWVTKWDTQKDAAEFMQAYLKILEAQDATRRGPNTWVISEQPFADAFHVKKQGRRVVIVNGPTVSALTKIRTNITIGQKTTPTPTTTQTP
ncbi:MAG: Hvo_1808 family surface protein, partial [Halobacteriaceae archaeon]